MKDGSAPSGSDPSRSSSREMNPIETWVFLTKKTFPSSSIWSRYHRSACAGAFATNVSLGGSASSHTRRSLIIWYRSCEENCTSISSYRGIVPLLEDRGREFYYTSQMSFYISIEVSQRKTVCGNTLYKEGDEDCRRKNNGKRRFFFKLPA